MPDLFALAMPWWEFILRAVVVYVVVLGMVRLGGKRALGQITPFDVLLIVLLGNAVQNALLGTDTSLGGGLLLAATLIVLNYGVGWLTTRNRRMERMIEGEPTVIARDGRLLEGVLRRELISRADFDAALRQQVGCRLKMCRLPCWRRPGTSPSSRGRAADQRRAHARTTTPSEPVAWHQVVGQARLGAARFRVKPYSQRTRGGRLIRMLSLRPPLCSPNRCRGHRPG